MSLVDAPPGLGQSVALTPDDLPSSTPENDDAMRKMYGYEDPDTPSSPVIPQVDYGYEDPDAAAAQRNKINSTSAPPSTIIGGAGCGSKPLMPRRSSMKQTTRMNGQNVPRMRRRASIQTVGIIEVRLPGQSRPVQRRTSIDFAPTPATIVVDERNNGMDVNDASETMNQTYVDNQWMSKEEYDKIAHDNHKIVRAIEKGTDKHFCTRGLEKELHSKSKSHIKGKVNGDGNGTNMNIDQITKQAREAVWEEQLRQKKEGIYDEAQIMEKYRLATIQAKLDAADRAEQDTAEIEGYVKKTRKMMRRMSC